MLGGGKVVEPALLKSVEKPGNIYYIHFKVAKIILLLKRLCDVSTLYLAHNPFSLRITSIYKVLRAPWHKFGVLKGSDLSMVNVMPSFTKRSPLCIF